MQRSINGRFLGAVLLLALALGSSCAASLRLGETGRVVLQFTVNADGKAVEPFRVDKEQSLSSSARLIVAAEGYVKDARFVGPAPDKKVLTASFVWELAPCGLLGHGPVHDYTINLCRDPPPQPDVQNPGVALSPDK